MLPLSILLRRETLGYAFGSDGNLINHLLFMSCDVENAEFQMPSIITGLNERPDIIILKKQNMYSIRTYCGVRNKHSNEY